MFSQTAVLDKPFSSTGSIQEMLLILYPTHHPLPFLVLPIHQLPPSIPQSSLSPCTKQIPSSGLPAGLQSFPTSIVLTTHCQPPIQSRQFFQPSTMAEYNVDLCAHIHGLCRMTLAQRLDELSVANSEGLLKCVLSPLAFLSDNASCIYLYSDDEYRLLRQSLFDRFASGSPLPSETPLVPVTIVSRTDSNRDERGGSPPFPPMSYRWCSPFPILIFRVHSVVTPSPPFITA